MQTKNGFVEQKIMPIMGKISENKVIKSITNGMMSTMPLSLGTSIIAIVANFPVDSWTNFLAQTGISVHTSAIISGTTTILALYLAFIIGYYNAKLRDSDSMTAGVLSLAAFLILMPQTVTAADGTVTNALAQTYLGSSGVFVAILCGVLVSSLFVFLKRKGLVIKLPDSVPEMVAKSLSPTFIAMIVFVCILAVRIVFGYTEYGNVFDFINKIIGAPLMGVGSSVWTLMAIYALSNFLWCFGIHPSALTSVLTPVFLTAFTSNIEAFGNGQVIPYLAFVVVYQFIMIGGTGSTLGLSIDMLLFSKSERYKTMGKLAIIPNIFNINEPVIFGVPILYNPLFIAPMTLSAFVNGITAFIFVNLGWFANYNPAVKVPWTMPSPIIHFLQSGIGPCVVAIIVIILSALLYLPFFKAADRIALKEEVEGKQ